MRNINFYIYFFIISGVGDRVQGMALAGVHNKSHIVYVWDEQNPYGIQFNFFYEQDILIHPGFAF